MIAAYGPTPGDGPLLCEGAFDWGSMRGYFADLTPPEVVELSVAVMFAGHEMTVNLLSNGVLALLSADAERDRFVHDPWALAEPAVEEFLRFDSPAQFIARAVIEPTELGGRQLRPGDALVHVLGSANRDEAVFDNADRLDVGRPWSGVSSSESGPSTHTVDGRAAAGDRLRQRSVRRRSVGSSARPRTRGPR